MILPTVIQDVLSQEEKHIIENNVISDIENKKINHILESLYLFTFKKYEGFSQFKLKL